MMGPKQVAQGALFYEFSIEDHVPRDHILRTIDRRDMAHALVLSGQMLPLCWRFSVRTISSPRSLTCVNSEGFN